MKSRSNVQRHSPTQIICYIVVLTFLILSTLYNFLTNRVIVAQDSRLSVSEDIWTFFVVRCDLASNSEKADFCDKTDRKINHHGRLKRFM